MAVLPTELAGPGERGKREEMSPLEAEAVWRWQCCQQSLPGQGGERGKREEMPPPRNSPGQGGGAAEEKKCPPPCSSSSSFTLCAFQRVARGG